MTDQNKIILPASFYTQAAPVVARGLLGKVLVRKINNQRISGTIIEAEAYQSEKDLACHARSGRTARTEVMYGPAGHAYIYFTYGMHWMLNCVTDYENTPAAVLIRAINPIEGLDIIAEHRNNQPQKVWCNGPAKLCQALSINGELNGISLLNNNGALWIEDAEPIADKEIVSGPRVGINSVPEPWKSIHWRYLIKKFQKTLSK